MSQRIERDPNQCEGKVPFDSYVLANKVAKRRLKSKDKYARQLPYHCEICHLWHIRTKRR